jgi:hypothetical protein
MSVIETAAEFEQLILGCINLNQPVTAANVTKILGRKTKDVNIIIYQKLNPRGLVVQSGHEDSKPLWWTPDGLVKHQKKQQASSMESEWLETAETPTILEEERQRDRLRRRILDLLASGPLDGQSVTHKLNADATKVTFILFELRERKQVEWTDGIWSLPKQNELRRRILDLLATHPRSWHYFNNVGLLAEDIAPILQELEESKLITRAPGSLFCSRCNTNCSVFFLVKKPESKSLKARYGEQLVHIAATDKKEFQDDLATQIVEILRNRGAQSAESLEDSLGNRDLDDVKMALEELKSRKLVVQREDNRWIMTKPDSLKGSLFIQITETLRNGGAMHAEDLETEFEDVDLEDIENALKVLKSRKLVTQRDDKRWILPVPTEAKEQSDAEDSAATETKEDGSFEIDRKTLQKGVKDAIDKMEINQKRWAVCMRTSNPTLASDIMDHLATKPRNLSGLAHDLDMLGKFSEIGKICHELEKLAQISARETSHQGKIWSIVDKPARIKKLRQDFHLLVDNLCDLVTML